MKIPWDERKRTKEPRKTWFDFAQLDIDFFVEAMIVDARAKRLKAIGVLADDMVAVIFAKRGNEGISLVTLRPASRKETEAL